MGGMVYSASFSSVAVTAGQALFEIKAPTSGMIELLECFVSQTSDAGDAQAEVLKISIGRATASGTGGSSATPVAHLPGSPASACVVEVNNTTLGSSLTYIVRDAFNVQAGWAYRPLPETVIYVIAGGFLVVEGSAPADSLTMNGTITWAEYV